MALHTKAVKNHAYWLGNEIERVFPDLENPHENCDLRLNYWTLERGKIISNFIQIIINRPRIMTTKMQSLDIFNLSNKM